MSVYVVIASGPSLTSEDCEYVRQAMNAGKCEVIAVNNVGIDMFPDAKALVAHDSAFWRNYPKAIKFKGDKFCRQNMRYGKMYVTEGINGCNSGLMAMMIARDVYKASRIILLGMDMNSGGGLMHYFGKHPKPLRQTTSARFAAHIKQFDSWRGPDVINCTIGSSLKKFPFMSLRDVI